MKETHRRTLRELTERGTVLTHTLSDKPVHAIENTFTQEPSAVAPELYPQLRYLTISAHGAVNKISDPEYLDLWVGTASSQCEDQCAGDVVAGLSGSAE